MKKHARWQGLGKRGSRCELSLGAILLLAGHGLGAQGLTRYLDLASKHDSVFAAAKAQNQADSNYRAIGRANLLPSVNLTGSVGQADYTRQDTNAVSDKAYRYGPQTWSLQVSQPIYSAERLAAANEGEMRAARGALALSAAWQDLALRLGRAWYNYLLDLDQRDLVNAQLQSYLAQKEQAQRMRAAGIATLTDVEETAARAEIAQADLSSARASVAVRQREFSRIVGELPPAQLAPESLRIDYQALSVPGSIDDWVAIAREGNIGVAAQRAAYEIARAQLAKAKAGYQPSLSLVASQQNGATPNYFSASERTTQLSLQLSMNLYDGGGTTAQVRQADALVAKAASDVASAQDDVEIKVADAVLSIGASQERVVGLEKAKVAAEIAVTGMEAGLKAGLRTNTELLNAKQQLYLVRRDLSRERYALILRYLELQLLVGNEVEAVIARLTQAVQTR